MSSDAYRQLAAHLRSLARDPSTLLDPGVLDTLRSALVETQPWGDRASAAAYQALADEAERIRLEVAGIARARARLAYVSTIAAQTGRAGTLVAARYLEDAIIASADVLAGVASALRDGRSAVADAEDRDRYRAAIEQLRATADAAEPSTRATLSHAIEGLTALAGQLRSVTQLTAVAAGDQPASPETTASTTDRPVQSRSRPSPLAGTTGGHLESLRANLTLTSEVFRHAVRVGATLAAAVAISHLFPLGHGYWLPMTVMIVLKPDFAATVSRGLGRSVGTLLGAGLVTLLLAALAPSPTGLIVLTVALYATIVAVLRANYCSAPVLAGSLVEGYSPPLHLGEDLLGRGSPHERLRLGVVRGEERLYGSDELWN